MSIEQTSYKGAAFLSVELAKAPRSEKKEWDAGSDSSIISTDVESEDNDRKDLVDKIKWDFNTCGYLIFMSFTWIPANCAVKIGILPYIPLYGVIEDFQYSDSGLCLALLGSLALIPDTLITPWLKTVKARRLTHVAFLVLNQLAHVCIFVGYWTQNKLWIYAYTIFLGVGFDMTFTVGNAFGDPDSETVGVLHSRMTHYGRWFMVGAILSFYMQWVYLQLGFIPMAVISSGFGFVRLILQVLLYIRTPAKSKEEVLADKNQMIKDIASYPQGASVFALSVGSTIDMKKRKSAARLSKSVGHFTLSSYFSIYASSQFPLKSQILAQNMSKNIRIMGWPILYYVILTSNFVLSLLICLLGEGGGVYLNLKFGFASDIGANAVGLGYAVYVAYTFYNVRASPDSALKTFPTNLIIPLSPLSIMLLLCYLPYSIVPASEVVWSIVIAIFFLMLAIIEVQLIAVRQIVVDQEDWYRFNVAMNFVFCAAKPLFGLAVFPLFADSVIVYEWVLEGCFVAVTVIIGIFCYVWRSSEVSQANEV